MNFTELLMYSYSTIAILSALAVISSINPIHSVLFLILVFVNASALLILLEAEFLAITLIIIYVGAIAVLFPFVVMMLNIKIVISNFNILRYIPIGAIISIVFIIELLLIVERNLPHSSDVSINNSHNQEVIQWIYSINYVSNIEAIGNIIYTYYYDLFIISGFILLVAMIGAISLTLHINQNIKRQQIFFQVYE